MSRFALALAIMVSLIITPRTEAQNATPASTPRASGPLLKLDLVDTPSDHPVIVSIIRTTYDGGGQQTVVAGSGPSLLFIETGTFVVVPDDATPAPRIVRAGGIDPVASDQDNPSITLMAGDAVLLPATSKALLRNNGTDSATTLTLLSTEDAQRLGESGVSDAVLVQLDTTLPPAPLALTLTTATLAPGESFTLAPAPTVTVLAVIERSQAFSLSGASTFNRGKRPIDLYVLTLTSTSAQVVTPIVAERDV